MDTSQEDSTLEQDKPAFRIIEDYSPKPGIIQLTHECCFGSALTYLFFREHLYPNSTSLLRHNNLPTHSSKVPCMVHETDSECDHLIIWCCPISCVTISICYDCLCSMTMDTLKLKLLKNIPHPSSMYYFFKQDFPFIESFRGCLCYTPENIPNYPNDDVVKNQGIIYGDGLWGFLHSWPLEDYDFENIQDHIEFFKEHIKNETVLPAYGDGARILPIFATEEDADYFFEHRGEVVGNPYNIVFQIIEDTTMAGDTDTIQAKGVKRSHDPTSDSTRNVRPKLQNAKKRLNRDNIDDIRNVKPRIE